MIAWHYFRTIFTRITVLTSLRSVTQDAIRARYSSLSLRGFVGRYGTEYGKTGYDHYQHAYGLALYLPQSTSVYPPHRTTSWIYALSDQECLPRFKLPVGLVEHIAFNSGSPFGFNSTLAALSTVPPAPTTSSASVPSTSPVFVANELMVHRTANKGVRPRYIIVRKRIYVPPRDDLDEQDRFFEPVFENIEERRQAQRLYREFFGQLVSMPPVPEERLWGMSLALALLNFLGLAARFVWDSRRRTRACFMRAQVPEPRNTPTAPNSSASIALCTIDSLAVEDVDQIEEQIVESMVVVESLDQDTELEELDEIQTPVEKPAFVEEPMDIEDSDEIEERIVESMVLVESLDQNEEPAAALEHIATEPEETAVSVEELLGALALTPVSRPLRPRSASCIGQPEAHIAYVPLARRMSCLSRLRGYVPSYKLPSSPDPAQMVSFEQVAEPTFPALGNLPTVEEALARLDAVVPKLEQGVDKCKEAVDEVLARIHQRSTGPYASQPPPPLPIAPSPAPLPPPPPIPQVAPAIPPIPKARKIRVFTAGRALRLRP